MEKDNAIRVIDLHKSFRVPHDKSTSLKAAALNLFKKKKYTEMLAADGINFSVKRGEFLGIIGRNGSGKSTMLKMLAGIYLPDNGKIEINGKLSPFLEVGVGFNPELSGRDNVYLSGIILGLSRKEIDNKFEEIVDFAEMKEFIDQKVKNYSSGMQVRLAFSVAIQAHSDILLIDEVLAVGDANFQAKCNRVFHQLKKEGRTIVFVTHLMSAVTEYCDRVILLKDGKIFKEGLPKDVIGEYDKLNLERQDFDGADKAFWGSGTAQVEKIQYLTVGSEKPITRVDNNKPFSIKFTIKNNTDDANEIGFGFEIFKMDGTRCAAISFKNQGENKLILGSGETKEVTVALMENHLVPGSYYLDYRLSGKDFEEVVQACSYASKFSITGSVQGSGIVDFGAEWTLDSK
ncbi:MAG: ABC transporter ATP-binding protein [Bacillota bacterium]|nr:ABC transporter ATP-binding protein [Bacillota bacterium]